MEFSVHTGGRSEPFRHRRPLGELKGTGFRRIDSDFCNNHSREVGECPQEACSCRDCGHIRIGRGRDNRVPTQAAAWQARPRAPLPRDENPLQSGRDQLGTQPGRRGCPQLLRHPVRSLDRPLTAGIGISARDDAVAPVFTMKITQQRVATLQRASAGAARPLGNVLARAPYHSSFRRYEGAVRER
jgi:hypothetical protein